jgi:rhodanese-related sulfurtransferase
MQRVIDREKVRRLMGENAQLIEVLPPAEYREDHLPGAVNIPLRQLDARTAGQLKADRPIIVYCWDSA